MNFDEELLLTLVDKGLLALVGFAAVFVFNSVLQRRKARQELLHAVSGDRVQAYKELWKKSVVVAISSQDPISAEVRRSLRDEMTRWYYDSGGGLFLSHPAASLFMQARAALEDAKMSDDSIRSAFSRLRSQMKFDCGVYSEKEQYKDL